MIFHADFANGLRHLVAHTADVDVLCVRLLNPDGTRYWDWATFGGPRGQQRAEVTAIGTIGVPVVMASRAMTAQAMFSNVTWSSGVP